MDLAALQRHWDAFGRQDPYWAILAHPAHRGNRWPLDEFFETGRREIAAVMADAGRHGLPAHRRRALDFGCGAGRLTQALAGHFETVLGIDVAPSMIALARTHNQHGDRCHYEVNDRPDLSRWPDASFDLIYTGRVLQHIEPRYSTAYVAEFVRLLAAGGYLSFDLPSEAGDAAAEAGGHVPPSAMRARVEIDSPHSSGTLAAGSTATFRATITNLSDRVWHSTAAHVINLGNHWVDHTGAITAYDDGRTRLPAVLGPGDSTQADIAVTAPDAPGTYRLQFDVVQEGVAWFATCGSTLTEITVHVGGEATSPPARADAAAAGGGDTPGDAPASFEPVMEMHAVGRAQVEAILIGAGARLMDVRPVHHCGPLWTAYRYDVTR